MAKHQAASAMIEAWNKMRFDGGDQADGDNGV
jgi:hypothetical protein